MDSNSHSVTSQTENAAPQRGSTVTPPIDYMATKQQGSRDAVKLDIQSGMTYKEAAAKHGVASGTIRQWAHRGKWVSPLKVRQITKAVSQSVTRGITSTIAEVISEREINSHRRKVWDIASASVAKFKVKAPRSAREFEILDKAARRSAGLENDDAQKQLMILNLNESIEEFQPQEASASATLQPSSSEPLDLAVQEAEVTG